MRLDGSTAYIFSPAAKETLFVRREMECFNETAMRLTHPLRSDTDAALPAAEQARRAAMSRQEREQIKKERAVVQVSILPGCVAYRRGGWEDDAPSEKTGGGSKGEARGIRMRRLTDAWVSCRWGVERRWKDRKPADQPALHGSRWGGGFVEFFPGVEGLVDPNEAAEKE